MCAFLLSLLDLGFNTMSIVKYISIYRWITLSNAIYLKKGQDD